MIESEPISKLTESVFLRPLIDTWIEGELLKELLVSRRETFITRALDAKVDMV